jgi:hypothetical protein
VGGGRGGASLTPNDASPSRPTYAPPSSRPRGAAAPPPPPPPTALGTAAALLQRDGLFLNAPLTSATAGLEMDYWAEANEVGWCKLNYVEP